MQVRTDSRAPAGQHFPRNSEKLQQGRHVAGLPLSHIREGVQVPPYHLCAPKLLHHREPRGSCKGQHIPEGLAWGPQRC